MIGHRGKRLCALLLALGLVPLGTAAVRTSPMEETVPVEITAPSAMLVEAETGTVIFEKNADEQRPVASVTKLMTLLLTFEALEEGTVSLEDQVTVSRAAAGQIGSQALLDAGSVYSLKELLKSTIIASANDSAYALAEYLAGTETDFVARMNERAQELGMTDTVYVNCTGLPVEGQHTTARDVALLSCQMCTHPEYFTYGAVWMDTLTHPSGRVTDLTNTNRLVRFYNGATGLKTGSTSSAGCCISATAERDGMELIAVILGGSTSDKRFSDAKALLNYGFAAYSLVTVTPESPLPAVPVTLGTQKTVQSVLTSESALLLEKSRANGLTQAVSLPESIDAPVEEGEPLGTLDIFDANGTPVASLPLLAGESIPHLTWSELFCRLLKLAYCGV